MIHSQNNAWLSQESLRRPLRRKCSNKMISVFKHDATLRIPKSLNFGARIVEIYALLNDTWKSILTFHPYQTVTWHFQTPLIGQVRKASHHPYKYETEQEFSLLIPQMSSWEQHQNIIKPQVIFCKVCISFKPCVIKECISYVNIQVYFQFLSLSFHK